MRQTPRLAGRVFNRPLLVDPRFAEIVASIVAPRVGLTVNVQAPGELTPAPVRTPQTINGIRVIPIVGALAHRGDAFDAECNNMISYTYLQNALVDAVEDPNIRGILLDVDSPGGEAGGCFELSDTVRDAREKKAIFAIANTQACSAAYLIGSSATRFFATQSAEVGSIGVVCLHVDMSKAIEAAGLVTTFIYAGAHKVDGNAFQPLPKDVRADIQASIDEAYSLFVSQVAARRPMSTEDIRKTEARTFSAEAAKKLGLVDEVMSFQAALDALETHLAEARLGVTTGARSMTTATQQPPAPTGISQEAHAAALAQARAEGKAEGRTEAADILLSDEAKGKTNAAAKLVRNAKLDKAEILSMLADVPATNATSGALDKLMANHAPKVGADAPAGPQDEEATREARRKELRGVGKNVSLRYGTPQN